MEKLIILGSGPAGLTAAIYAARADNSPLVIDGLQPGGQLMITTDVENFPGFPDGIMGPQLMMEMRKQAERFGTRFVSGIVEEVDFKERPFKIKTDSDTFSAKSVIIATGASAKLLNIPAENKYMGKGLSACATCDGFFFRDKDIMVVGGGDTAVEEAVFLTKFAKSVKIVHRRDSLRASKIMQHKALNNKKISFIWNAVIDDIKGEQFVTSAILKDTKTGEKKEYPIDGIFVAIGHQPNTGFLVNQIELDQNGYILVKDLTKTSVSGVFAAGDVQDKRYRQAVSAAGSGCMAALDAEKYLEDEEE